MRTAQAEPLIVDHDSGWDAAVLYYDAHQHRNRLTLIDTSTAVGRFQFAMHTSKRGNAVMVWRPIDWQAGTVH
jgi:hypothetical protein